MDRIRIRGGRALSGLIPISGAKNAALPLLAATLLTDQPLTLRNLPRLADIESMLALLAQHGTEIEILDPDHDRGDGSRAAILRTRDLASTEAPYDIVRKMRASVLVLGPLVARAGEARVSLPGGCAIGARPIDLHLKGLQALGAEIELSEGYVIARAPEGLRGAQFVFPQVSVGATENLVMAAALARGRTELVNAAREPEVVDLCRCLNLMGARIEGVGTDRLTIDGVDRLVDADYAILPDRIEAGTYAVAAAITGGSVVLGGARAEHLPAFVDKMREAGVTMRQTSDGLAVARANGRVAGVDVMTEPFPGFATDLQAQIMTLFTLADGASMVTETIFENRFMHVPELCRMGANITVHHASAMVRGVARLTGAPVMATDLRASVSLVLAGLAAEGVTTVNRVYHLDRGYERLEQKLAAVGAEIERVKA